MCLALCAGLWLGLAGDVRAQAPGEALPAAAEAPPAVEPAEPAPARPASRSAAVTGPVEQLAAAFRPNDRDEPLEDRVVRVRREASRMGMWSAEPAARGLLLSDRLGSDPERARAAVMLAPGLPAAWGALAVSTPSAAPGALARGLIEMERHLDASIWWRATAWHVLAWGLVIGGLLFLAGSALRIGPDAAHDLSHRLPGRIPPPAIAAIGVSLALLPAAAGEGWIGLAVGAFLVAWPWAASRHRAALLLALAGVVAAVHPVTGQTGRWIAALRADPDAVAIRSAEVGGLSEVQRERLERIAPRDLAASHALALWNKRVGRLGEAQRWLDVARADESDHPVLLNDAAGVQLAVGDSGEAIRLYENATLRRNDAAILFNLAQVHGSRIELGEQEAVLEAAHSVSAATVRELSELRGDGRLIVDVAWPVSELRGRLADAADGSGVAAVLRRSFGTGRSVEQPAAAAGALAVLVFVGMALGRGRAPSTVCGFCRARRCERCQPRRSTGCAVCGAPGGRPSWIDLGVGAVRPLALRVVPGLAGIAAGKPWLGWIAATAAATAGVAIVLRAGVVADPIAAGYTGQVAFVLAGVLLAAVSGLATLRSLRSLS